MYQSLGEEFFHKRPSCSQENNDGANVSLTTNQEREIFTTSILNKFLNEKKLKEIDSLTDKIKYKRHLLDMSTKEIKKEANKSKLKSNAKSNKKKIKLTCKLKKKFKMYKLDKSEKLNYCDYEKINDAWSTYACSCLLTCMPKNIDPTKVNLEEENVLNCLKQIDYHGCHLTVTKSSNKSSIGISGIVLQDKKNVFYLLTQQNEIKILPKSGNLFQFEIFNCKITLVGSNIACKPEMRVTKHAKIKTKLDIK